VEGDTCTASGIGAHAEGRQTTATGSYSHANGIGARAKVAGQTAVGTWNADDGTAMLIVGIG
jgi:hypothetical protein